MVDDEVEDDIWPEVDANNSDWMSSSLPSSFKTTSLGAFTINDGRLPPVIAFEMVPQELNVAALKAVIPSKVKSLADEFFNR